MSPDASRRRLTLRRTLTVIVIATVALMAVLTVSLSTLVLRNSLIGQLDSNLIQASSRSTSTLPLSAPNRDATDALTPPDSDSSGDRRPPGLLGAGQNANTISMFIDADTIRAGYFDETAEFHELTAAQIAALSELPHDDLVRTVSIPGLGSYRALSTVDDSGNVVVTALPLESVTTTVNRFVFTAGAIGAALALIAALIGAYLVKRALRPLDEVAATAQRITRTPLGPGTVELSNRVDAAYTDARTEVGQVGLSLNSMIDHIEEALTAREASERKLRSFVADASHELRTPLASIRGYAELLTRTSPALTADESQGLARIESESERMARLVEDLLLLARLDNSRPLESTVFDPSPIVIETVADAHVISPDHNWSIELPDSGDDASDDDSGAELRAVGDPVAFRQIVGNLVANARVHTPPDTRVTVALGRTADGVVLTVADDGPGVPENIRSTLFDRFVKGSESRTPGKGSSGLGLSIVSALVAAQHGTIRLETTAGRTAFIVTLPAAGQ